MTPICIPHGNKTSKNSVAYSVPSKTKETCPQEKYFRRSRDKCRLCHIEYHGLVQGRIIIAGDMMFKVFSSGQSINNMGCRIQFGLFARI
jgi:hypothetical protein